MARDLFIQPTINTGDNYPARLGATADAAGRYDYNEVGKLVKLAGESRFVLAVAGDDIDGQIFSVELAPQNGWSIGSVTFYEPSDMLTVVFDGLQATPGTGTVAIGDIVNAGSITAKGTKLTSYPKVCKATNAANVVQKWRVVSLGTAGTGAVGTVGVIQRI